MSRLTLNYPLFDGEKIIEKASVTIEDGIITNISEAEKVNSDGLLMPGLIDAHTHMTNEEQIDVMLKNGVVATCDVSAPPSLVTNSKGFTIVSSAGMTMGTLNGKAYVKKAIESGAKYIKVLLFEPNVMPKAVLKSICQAAHENSLKVAVHATSVKMETAAVECGADILLHVPMKEQLPETLAQEIAEKKIAVAPTLIMMETFANSKKNGYLSEHYLNAENAVYMLNKYKVNILAATDANVGSFAPAVEYGASMHREMELLHKAGLSTLEVLKSATSNIANVFGINDMGFAKVGKKADLILLGARADKNITDIKNIKQIWVNKG